MTGAEEIANALGVACADLEIPLSEVVAMGDSETDIEMFNVAGANFPVIQEIKKYVYAKGKGEMEMYFVRRNTAA